MELTNENLQEKLAELLDLSQPAPEQIAPLRFPFETDLHWPHLRTVDGGKTITGWVQINDAFNVFVHVEEDLKISGVDCAAPRAYVSLLSSVDRDPLKWQWLGNYESRFYRVGDGYRRVTDHARGALLSLAEEIAARTVAENLEARWQAHLIATFNEALTWRVNVDRKLKEAGLKIEKLLADHGAQVEKERSWQAHLS
jgi:hypothetical protein